MLQEYWKQKHTKNINKNSQRSFRERVRDSIVSDGCDYKRLERRRPLQERARETEYRSEQVLVTKTKHKSDREWRNDNKTWELKWRSNDEKRQALAMVADEGVSTATREEQILAVCSFEIRD
jgi:hypothetical protein